MPQKSLTRVLASGRDPQELLDELGYPLTDIELSWRLNALGDDGIAFDAWLEREGLYSHIEAIKREAERLHQDSGSELPFAQWARTMQVELEESLDEISADPDIANLLDMGDEVNPPEALYEHFIDPTYGRLAGLMIQFRKDVETRLLKAQTKALRPQLSEFNSVGAVTAAEGPELPGL